MILQSHTISIGIECPLAKAYAFMSDPRNLLSWASLPAESLEPISLYAIHADLQTGPATIRFTEPNAFGVLDYHVLPDGADKSRDVCVRVVENGDGCQLNFMMLKDEAASDEMFASDIEWMTTELLVLKSLLEERHG